MSRRRRSASSSSSSSSSPSAGEVDLRAAARALLAGERSPLAIEDRALTRILEVARADAPIMVPAPAAGVLDPEARRAAEVDVRGSVAVVPLQGVITPRGSWLSLLFGGGAGGLQGFRRTFRAALGDPDVEAVVLDVHSPGGSIALVPEVAAEVRAARGSKPIVASVNTLCASAAYWIAAQADEVTITPSGLAGSIGVYVLHEDWSGFNESLGVQPTYVYAGRYKVEGNFDEPLGDEAKAALQAEVDDLYGMFADDVAAGRGTTADAVRAGYGEGRVLPAGRAVAELLADRVATIDDTIRELDAGRRPGPQVRRASDPSPTIRAEDEVDNPGPNAAGTVAEEVRARIAELQTLPDPQTL